LSTKVALVTGAASGIGAAIATRFKQNGWQVASIDKNKSNTDLSIEADVSDFKSINDAVLKIEKELGPIEAAISNAGHYEMKSITEVSDESLLKMFAVHLGGLRNIALSVLPLMRKRKNGSLICITSELGIGGGEFVSHYSAAKGAQIGLVKTLSLEYAPFNIRVNAVAPGPTDTPLIPLDSPERQPEFLNTLPLKRLVKPEEISQAVWFLASEGTFFSGEIISPNAGAVI
jgi:NAD(P)-dependent dehydrogenase (short-subunit alcohol dehydrogenase family)